MAFKLAERYGRSIEQNDTYFCDDVADLDSIPSDEMGTSAYVVNTCEVYVKNSEGKWVLQ